MKKKWLIIGLENSGKTSVAELIERTKLCKDKRLDLVYREHTIEVPGAYIENNFLNNFIIMVAENHAKGTLFIIQSDKKNIYPPKFAKCFTMPVAIVVTKSELIDYDEKIIKYKKLLEIGTSNIFFISFKTGEGLEELKDFLRKTNGGVK